MHFCCFYSVGVGGASGVGGVSGVGGTSGVDDPVMVSTTFCTVSVTASITLSTASSTAFVMFSMIDGVVVAVSSEEVATCSVVDACSVDGVEVDSVGGVVVAFSSCAGGGITLSAGGVEVETDSVVDAVGAVAVGSVVVAVESVVVAFSSCGGSVNDAKEIILLMKNIDPLVSPWATILSPVLMSERVSG